MSFFGAKIRTFSESANFLGKNIPFIGVYLINKYAVAPPPLGKDGRKGATSYP